MLDFACSMSVALGSVAAHGDRRAAVPPEAVRPPLKWAGGKRWQVPIVWKYWQTEQHRRLVEPFCGGLAVALGLMPTRALLNDVNPHLINFYAHLRRGFTADLPMSNSRTGTTPHRKEFNRLIAGGQAESKRAAELFYYLNRTGYNGLCRFNRSGLFNVPFGRHTIRDYRRDFSEYRERVCELGFHGCELRRAAAPAGRLRLRRSALRRRVHELLEERIRMGAAGEDRRPAGAASRAGRAVESGAPTRSTSSIDRWDIA